MVNFIVSGCPRSGTSMIMRILFSAGIEIAKDDKRKADDDNIHGYFEIDMIINKLKGNPNLVFKYDNMALKVTHFGLQYLPKGNYKIIYIERDIEEVLDSMEKMMGEKDKNREETKKAFLNFNEKSKKMMDEREDIDYIIVNHRDLLTDPEPIIHKIIEFMDIKPSKKKSMLDAIDKKSYRNKR